MKSRRAAGRGQAVRTDVTSEAEFKALADRAVKTYGGIHGVCHAAGVGNTAKLISDLSLAEWERVIRINLTAPFLCVKHLAPAILASGGGSIVIVASTSSMTAVARAAEYCASKAGVLGLVRSASCEYASMGVRVNAVMAGTTRTPMLASALAEAEKSGTGLEAYLASVHPIGRFAEPIEIGTAIRWLISDEASFVTGSAMAVDGGWTSI